MTNPTGSDTPESAAPPAAAKASFWEDFIDIFHSPSDVFARRENASFWKPLIVVTLLVGVLTFAFSGVLSPIRDAAMAKGMAAALKANPQMTAEQAATGRKGGDIISNVGAFVFIPIAIFVIGLFM